MSILDRFRGKKEEPKKPEGKKPVSVKREKEREKPAKKAKVEKSKKDVKTKKIIKKEKNIAHRILIEPLVTEKSSGLGQFNQYVFKVSREASKGQIREAVQDYYGVGVNGVNVIEIHPKKRIHGRTIGYKKGYKKAIVKLQQGDTIGIAEGV